MAIKLTRTEALVLEACKNACKEAPLTRRGLKDITHMSDRNSRNVIDALRDKGMRIACSKSGYYYAFETLDYSEWIRQYSSYAYTILTRKAAMDRYIEGQIEMDIEIIQ